jgi:hypothetical protein
MKTDNIKRDPASSIVELLHDEGEKAIELMTPTPKVPMVGAY